MPLKKIVVAEDDDAIAHMVSMALGDAGFLCIRARDGLEALGAVAMHQPDLLVLDVMMPRLDGRSVAQKLTDDPILSKIPIMMLTSLTDVDNRVAGLDAGADDYMAKPFDLREFSARVRALIRISKREADRNATTNLPGSMAIEERIERALKEPCVVAQFAVAGFANYVAQVGPEVSTGFVRSLGEALYGIIRDAGGFLGHLGGTDFVATISKEEAEEVVRSTVEMFDASRVAWMGENLLPVHLICGMVVTDSATNSAEVIRCLAEALKKARGKKESNYVLHTTSI